MSLHVVALLVGLSSATSTLNPAPAARLEVAYERETLVGTCALIYTESVGDGATLYFVTSSRLFQTPEGRRYPAPRDVRVILEDGQVIAVPTKGIRLPMGTLVDVAILHATASPGRLASATVDLAPPLAGTPFTIAGYDDEGLSVVSEQRVRFASARFVVGERDASRIPGCVGAPAFTADGIFGIVSECDANRAPTVTLLSFASAFLERTIPGLLAHPTLRH